MIELWNLKNSTRPKQKHQRVGRGPASGRGKTCGRGHKGQGSRCGATLRIGYEGGQMRLFRRLPNRGFSRGMFAKLHVAVNLSWIQEMFEDGEVVNIQTMQDKGFIGHNVPGGLKILSKGELSKKITIEARSFSKEAIRKLEESKISYKILEF
ncbi:MAG: 50S ribosomal protein L15 [Chlamydiota bacterium]